MATYNVHRWAGLNGASAPDAARAGFVISELDADVIALQEVLRPFDEEDPLERLADAMHLHIAFVATRVHRRGEIGNAILSRWPITSVFTLDLSFSRVERRSAVAAQFQSEAGPLSVVATHLALVDRTRRLQVDSILGHPQLQGDGPAARRPERLAALQGDAHARARARRRRARSTGRAASRRRVRSWRWTASTRGAPRSSRWPRTRARPRAGPRITCRVVGAPEAGLPPRLLGGARDCGSSLVGLVLLLGCATVEGYRLFEAGNAALDRGDAAAAVAELERAATLVPERSEVQNHLGLAYAAAGRPRDALAAFERAVALDCDNRAAQREPRCRTRRQSRRRLSSPVDPADPISYGRPMSHDLEHKALADYLEDHNLKHTKQREAILEVFLGVRGPHHRARTSTSGCARSTRRSATRRSTAR